MMDGKGFGRKRSWPNLRYYAGIRLESVRKTSNNLNQHSRSPGIKVVVLYEIYELFLLACLYYFMSNGVVLCYSNTVDTKVNSNSLYVFDT
jgi:hypothetical protein